LLFFDQTVFEAFVASFNERVANYSFLKIANCYFSNAHTMFEGPFILSIFATVKTSAEATEVILLNKLQF
jgi:hypothetical protein